MPYRRNSSPGPDGRAITEVSSAAPNPSKARSCPTPGRTGIGCREGREKSTRNWSNESALSVEPGSTASQQIPSGSIAIHWISQICFTSSARLAPTCLPAFQASRPSAAGSYCEIPTTLLPSANMANGEIMRRRIRIVRFQTEARKAVVPQTPPKQILGYASRQRSPHRDRRSPEHSIHSQEFSALVGYPLWNT